LYFWVWDFRYFTPPLKFFPKKLQTNKILEKCGKKTMQCFFRELLTK
jgi:hypothetical protein